MKPKRGERYLNYLGEYCVIKSVYKDIIKMQICGTKSRTVIWKLKDFYSPWIGHFRKIPYPKINRTNIARHLLEYQLNMIGKTTEDTKHLDNWFKEWSMTKIEHDFLKSYAIPLLRKTFKINKTRANQTFAWFDLQFGLKQK